MRAPAGHVAATIITSILCVLPLTPGRAQTAAPVNASGAIASSSQRQNRSVVVPHPLIKPIGSSGHKRRQLAALEARVPAPAPVTTIGRSAHKRRHETVRPPTSSVFTPVRGASHKRRHVPLVAQARLGPNVFVSTLGPLSPSTQSLDSLTTGAAGSSVSPLQSGVVAASSGPPAGSVPGLEIFVGAQEQRSAPMVSTGLKSVAEPTPEPGMLLLVGTGLIGVAAAASRRKWATVPAGRP